MVSSNIIYTENNNSDNKSVSIVVEGEATIRNEEEFYNLFISFLNIHNEFLIKLADIKNIDLPFIQLLISIEKTVKSVGKNLKFDLEIASSSENILRNAGIKLSEVFENVDLKIANIS